jgi:hypothetical protein
MADAPVAIGLGIPVVIRSYDGRISAGAMDVREMSLGLRVGRALKALGICWMFAVIAVLVPILHWLLVPSLVLLGPIVAARAFSHERQVCGGGGPCPVCGSPIVFHHSAHPGSFNQPCRVCRLSLHVTPAVASPT